MNLLILGQEPNELNLGQKKIINRSIRNYFFYNFPFDFKRQNIRLQEIRETSDLLRNYMNFLCILIGFSKLSFRRFHLFPLNKHAKEIVYFVK